VESAGLTTIAVGSIQEAISYVSRMNHGKVPGDVAQIAV